MTVHRSSMNDNNNDSLLQPKIADHNMNNKINMNIPRRDWLLSSMAGMMTSLAVLSSNNANAQVYFDPAQYGDQELRIGAVDSVKESVRRAILQNPQLAPSFYIIALLDGLSYNMDSKLYGPDGRIIYNILSSKDTTNTNVQNLQNAALVLIETEQKLRKKVQISIADAIAIGGAEAIESIGGPILTVQLGRPDLPSDKKLSPIPIDLLSGTNTIDNIMATFKQSGLSEREATVLIAGLLTLNKVDKTRDASDWKSSAKPKFREPGKIGRMSEFRPVTEDDIAQAELDEELEEDLNIQTDGGWYISDSFGTKDDRFGQRLGKEDINEKTFNKYIKELVVLNTPTSTTTTSTSNSIINDEFGWTGIFLTNSNEKYPVTASYLQKYQKSNINFLKDLNIAYNTVTQLGAVYTGGKYENLLQKGPKKSSSLNNDDLKLF